MGHMMDLGAYINELGTKARKAAIEMARADSATKRDALLRIAEAVEKHSGRILESNARDLAAGKAAGLTQAMLDRLTLTEKRIVAMAHAIAEIADQPDPVGEIEHSVIRPSGIRVGRMRVPIGVIGIIYEARPNVTTDAAALCLKAGNACVLRGGKEALHSNVALARVVSETAAAAGLPPDAVQLVSITDRETVSLMAQAEGLIDVIIPRGGEALIRSVVAAAKVPVIKHYKGVCHTFVDVDADLDMARRICFNAKVQRPGVCNAMETLLVHEKVAEAFLPTLLAEYREAGVSLRGCNRTIEIDPTVARATEEDWYAEYLDLILAVRVVSSLDEAIEHIRRYGSAHTDAIVTRNIQTAERFVREVDSSSVMVNVSTRFSDGGEYGLGAEIGISTDKLHARGPMGAADLTTTKWVVTGNGAIRQ